MLVEPVKRKTRHKLSIIVQFLQIFRVCGGSNGGNLRYGTCGQKCHLHTEIGVSTAGGKVGNWCALRSERGASYALHPLL